MAHQASRFTKIAFRLLSVIFLVATSLPKSLNISFFRKKRELDFDNFFLKKHFSFDLD